MRIDIIIINVLILCSYLFGTTIPSEETYNEKLKYIGGWPESTNRNLNSPDMIFDCPGDIGCSCVIDSDCSNDNCGKLPKGKYCLPKKGDLFPDFQGIDQYGDTVSVYDFSLHNKYILVEMGTTWCTPCHLLSNWLAYNDQEITTKKFWKPEYQQIYDLIQKNKLYYITILYEDDFKDNVTYDTLYDWFINYPDEKIPILGDVDKFLHMWLKPTGLPAVILLNENMQIVTYSSRGMNNAFDDIIKITNDN